jgi:hypothetical protein
MSVARDCNLSAFKIYEISTSRAVDYKRQGRIYHEADKA